jgi:hypothetical protein
MSKTETPSNTYTLNDLATATRRRLGPTRFVLGEDIEVELPSIFRLPKKTREKVWETLKQVDEIGDGDDGDEIAGYELLVETISAVLLQITDDAQLILDAVASDDPLYTANLLGEILGKWMENTQAGEA